jgi:hypothetical protein
MRPGASEAALHNPGKAGDFKRTMSAFQYHARPYRPRDRHRCVVFDESGNSDLLPIPFGCGQAFQDEKFSLVLADRALTDYETEQSCWPSLIAQTRVYAGSR